MKVLLLASLVMAVGCTSQQSSSASRDEKDCLVLLRNDASLGGQGQSDDGETTVPWFHGRVQSITENWLVLRTSSGYDYYIPRESILIAGVSRR